MSMCRCQPRACKGTNECVCICVFHRTQQVVRSHFGSMAVAHRPKKKLRQRNDVVDVNKLCLALSPVFLVFGRVEEAPLRACAAVSTSQEGEAREVPTVGGRTASTLEAMLDVHSHQKLMQWVFSGINESMQLRF